jgi:hypothetical protein
MGVEGSIPEDVLVLVELSSVARDPTLSSVLNGYRAHIDGSVEPTYRARLADVYCRLVPSKDERVLSPQQRNALERCVCGDAYAEVLADSPVVPPSQGSTNAE